VVEQEVGQLVRLVALGPTGTVQRVVHDHASAAGEPEGASGESARLEMLKLLEAGAWHQPVRGHELHVAVCGDGIERDGLILLAAEPAAQIGGEALSLALETATQRVSPLKPSLKGGLHLVQEVSEQSQRPRREGLSSPEMNGEAPVGGGEALKSCRWPADPERVRGRRHGSIGR
jgi:hypothetical protein